MKTGRWVLVAVAVATIAARPAAASLHFMQIEQVIGGVNGDTGVQAVQLRMRTAFQNLVSNGRLVVRDAAGANPVLLIDFTSNVSNSSAGARVLAATASFSGATTPSLAPDFILTNPIPPSYLAAGSLTFEDDFGTIYWRLSWGGTSYTGSGAGSITNDADGNFNPPYAGPLPSTTTEALQFRFAASAPSTNNANDYQLTPGDATFTNNAGATGTINRLVGAGPPGTGAALAMGRPAPNPTRGSIAWSVDLPREARVRLRVLDLAGRLVSTVADRTLPPGRHGFAWDASRHRGPALANGVYFLELSAAGETRVRRFVVAR